MKKYPVVTLCGSTKFKDEFMQIQKELTLKGYIVISVGLFGHAGDKEVWEGLDENTLTKTKLMLDDMHKSKIDMAEGIFVINPGGYIGASTWSEICYAYMTDKHIDFIEPISESKIIQTVQIHIMNAEQYAARQYDTWSHWQSDFSSKSLLNDMVTIKKGKFVTMDPWVPQDTSVSVCDEPYIGHADKKSGYNPFKIYGKKNMARFVENINIKYNV